MLYSIEVEGKPSTLKDLIMTKEIEKLALEMIVNAGEARSLVFEAIQFASEGDIQQAKEKIQESYKTSDGAHKLQMELLTMEARGESPGSSVLLVHAQDILMATCTERDLAQYIIELFSRVDALENKEQGK